MTTGMGTGTGTGAGAVLPREAAVKLSAPARKRRLMQGSEAVAEAMIAAGCRFFAGYPMTPFTEVLENMARRLPEVGGVCMNAESEIEAVGMAWGAAATGALAATGSTGQGLSLMQEALSEITLARLPLVVLNMARGQGDYFQATRGGGHGDYRHIVLAPKDPAEAVGLLGRAFGLTVRWRNPVLVMGDYYLAHTAATIELPALSAPKTPNWALDGSSGGTGSAKLISFLGTRKQRDGSGYDLAEHYGECARSTAEMQRSVEPLFETTCTEDAELIVVAYGTPAKYVAAAVRQLRSEGLRVGCLRPVTLFPFPSEALAAAAAQPSVKALAVYENNQGQMIDDVRLSVLGAVPVQFIGGLSMDSSGFGIAPDLDVAVLGTRIRRALGQLTVAS